MDAKKHRYDDMINLPHPDSKRHPRMSLEMRAAQFAPFAALTGHGEAIIETARLTEDKIELDEDVLERLNEKFRIMEENLGTGKSVAITYFLPDNKKSGGSYVCHTGSVKKIDKYQRIVFMTDDTSIPMEQIKDIENEL